MHSLCFGIRIPIADTRLELHNAEDPGHHSIRQAILFSPLEENETLPNHGLKLSGNGLFILADSRSEFGGGFEVGRRKAHRRLNN